MFDSRLVGRAVFNLVNNALGAISDAVKNKIIELPSRGFNVWVTATSVTSGKYPDGGYCLVEVRDDGPGVPTEIKETLFTPQAISTTPGGTGIGTEVRKECRRRSWGARVDWIASRVRERGSG